jgi:uncharacterized BrkB/YihY/UPF0761 family membrane protein
MRKLFRTIKIVLGHYLKRRGPLFAQGIAYALLLGSMPLLLLTTSFSSFLYEIAPQIQTGLNDRIRGVIPPEVAEPMITHLGEITNDWAQFGIIGIIIIALVSKGIFDALGGGLTAVMGNRDRHMLWVHHVFSILLTIITILFVIVASLGNFIVQFIIDSASLSPDFFGFYIAMFSISLLGTTLILVYYTYSRVTLKMLPTIIVSFGVSLFWHVIGYTGRYVVLISGSRRLVYGFFAGTVLFMIWLQIFAHLVLLGGIVIARQSTSNPALSVKG